MDSTLIDLCAKVFEWAKYRTAKDGVKIHLLLDHDGLLPEFAIITGGQPSDIGTARNFSFPKGSMVVFDRGYCDYDWFAGFAPKGVHFVTRLKDNASWVALESRPVPADSNIRHDDIVAFAQHNTSDNERFFRRVVWWDETHERECVYLTNHLDLDASVVADVYRQRWQIELFFLVRYLPLRSRIHWHLSRFVALLRHQLFVYRDLWRFLDEPFEGPLPLRDDYIPPQSNLFSECDLGQHNNPITGSYSQPQPQTESGTNANALLSTPLITVLG